MSSGRANRALVGHIGAGRRLHGDDTRGRRRRATLNLAFGHPSSVIAACPCNISLSKDKMLLDMACEMVVLDSIRHHLLEELQQPSGGPVERVPPLPPDDA